MTNALHAAAIAGAVVLLVGALWVGLEEISGTARVLARLEAAASGSPMESTIAEIVAAASAPQRLAVAAGGGAVLAVAFTNPMVLALPCAVTAGAVALAPRLRRRRASRDGTERLIGVVDALALNLAGGAAVGAALVAAIQDHRPPAGDPLARLAADLAEGGPLQASLDRWADAAGEPEARLIADAIAVAGATGGAATGALLQVGDTLRDRAALDREIVALASQAELSSRMLTVVPVGFAAIVFVLDGRVASFALTTPLGWICIVGGLGLDLAGAAWMRRLVGSVR